MTLAYVDEMVADLRSGPLTAAMVCDLGLELVRAHAVTDIRAALPDDLGRLFAGWLDRDSGDDVPARDHVWFSAGRGDRPDHLLIIDRVRAWLADTATAPS